MSCSACRLAGQRMKYAKRDGRRHMPSVVYYPPIMMPGQPTIEGHRLSAEHMAEYVLAHGFAAALRDYDLERAELLVACWWAGRFGPRRLRRALGEWADAADPHLWASCINVPDPPRARAKEAA